MVLLAIAASGCGPRIPDVVPNDLQQPVGVVVHDTLRVNLVAQIARWRPDTNDTHTVLAATFAEDGKPPSIPGPLIRVAPGGAIALSIRNTLTDTLIVIGIGRHVAGFQGDTLLVAPGTTAARVATAPLSGTRAYFAVTMHGGKGLPGGAGHQLIGVLQVGEPRPGERLLGINFWQKLADSTREHSPELAFWTINGRMWPSTQRFAFDVGDTVRWRVVDMSADEHPMHLHGFYFRVDGLSSWAGDTTYAGDARRMVVTQVPPPGGSMAITWVPSRPGQWLFHCHKTPHMGAVNHHALDGDTTEMEMTPRTDPVAHLASGMGGLIIGITVRGALPAADTSVPAQRIRLLVQRKPNVFDRGTTDAFGYVMQGSAVPADDSVQVPGPVLALTRGALAEITVVNRLPVATTVHWHGIELDSYYDGVGGWSGATGRVAPMILAGDSFVVRIRPPRAGTFIYHTHLSESPQLNRGLVGALVVLDSGQQWDPARDHVVIVHVAGNGDSALVVANGRAEPAPIVVAANVPQRLRFITMMADDEADIMLTADSTPGSWRPVAKDGAALPASQAVSGPARVHMNPGETFDAEFTPRRLARPMRVAIRSFNPISIPIVVH